MSEDNGKKDDTIIVNGVRFRADPRPPEWALASARGEKVKIPDGTERTWADIDKGREDKAPPKRGL